MDDVWGAENHHPLGFKQHPLEDPGMYIYIYMRLQQFYIVV